MSASLAELLPVLIGPVWLSGLYESGLVSK